MSIRQDLSQIPGALQEMLEKGLPAFESLVRRFRFGEGPVFVVGSPALAPLGMTASYCFEDLAERVVVVRTTSAFMAYTLQALGPRSTVLILSRSGEAEDDLRAARLAKERGAIVWAFTSCRDSSLERMAHSVVSSRFSGADSSEIQTVVSEHTTLAALALASARVLRRPSPRILGCENDLLQLPRQMEWMAGKLGDAVGSMASKLQEQRKLFVVGVGAYHAIALQVALDFRRRLGREAVGTEVGEGLGDELDEQARALEDTAVLFLSGSRCRLKHDIHEAARRARIAGAEIISVTDSNDTELVMRSTLAMLLPSLTEVASAILSLALLEWVIGISGPEAGAKKKALRAKPPGASLKTQKLS